MPKGGNPGQGSALTPVLSQGRKRRGRGAEWLAPQQVAQPGRVCSAFPPGALRNAAARMAPLKLFERTADKQDVPKRQGTKRG